MTRPDTVVFDVDGSGEVHLSCSTEELTVLYTGPASHVLYVALSVDGEKRGDIHGSTIVPYAQGAEGSTVFLPFAADRIYCISQGQTWKRTWELMTWGGRSTECPEVRANATTPGQLGITVSWGGKIARCSMAAYVKDLSENDGWGAMVGSCDASLSPGGGDKAIETYLEASTDHTGRWSIQPAQRFIAQSRERIYELFVRLFSNTNTRRKRNGTLAENGCGKFPDINCSAIAEIAGMGFTHIWLMGVVRHATTTSYETYGLPADETDLMKGLAGSPYAIKDYFDVAPDLARDPGRRIEEFRELIERIHAAGLKVLVDFVGNHVSRGYESQVRPELSFGAEDDRSRFFAANNNFFYLGPTDAGGGPPLHLPTYDRESGRAISPTCAVKQDCDGLFAGEKYFGRVTGNNCISWAPLIDDWYETVKLNYGFEFTGRHTPQRCFPHAGSVDAPIPNTWIKVDAALGYWQDLGVDGFRCDMAHMLPPEFWRWSITRARRRDSDVFFMAEAYNDYFVVETTAPEVLALSNEPLANGLLHAGFNAVYGHDMYRVIKEIYDGDKWANDIDGVLGSESVFNHSVHYAENHDEVRLASPQAWGGKKYAVGRAVSAVLFGVGRGPILFYSGQEVGESAEEAEGFSGADGRTTLFDYWSMPEFSKWVNMGAFDGGQLSGEQQNLRSFYARLINVCGEEAFRNGLFLSLNPSNVDNPGYGRLAGETASGHWMYSFLRYDRKSKARFLVAANLHASRLTDVRIRLTPQALHFLEVGPAARLTLREVLNPGGLSIAVDSPASGLLIPEMPALLAYCFEIEVSG